MRGGKGTRLCNPTAAVADSTVTRRKYFFLFSHSPASWVNVKGQITLCNLLLKYIMAVQRCVVSLVVCGHGCGCVIGVLRAKAVK